MAIIYKHTCLISGKCYIGQTVKSIKRRWQEHCADAKYNTSRKFMLALKKHGTEDWTHEVLFESDDSRLINDKEIEYIKLFDSVKKGYNTSYEKFRDNTLHREDSIEKMKLSQKAAHARRREEGTEGGWTRKDGGPMLGKQHPGKGKSNANKGKKAGQTWEEIFGVEGAAKRREDARLRKLNKSEVR
jgi:group I intron endonuclease